MSTLQWQYLMGLLHLPHWMSVVLYSLPPYFLPSEMTVG